ncbi:MAG: hypothetical protein ABIQ44_09365 [Chloroflexia bacterium]
MADETAKKASAEETHVQPLDMDTIPVVADTVADTDNELHIGIEEFENQVVLERHDHNHRHDTGHVDLMQEEYTPEEVARLASTSLDVVMHAVWNGDLKADRQGHNVVCITHADVTDWLRRRAAE